MHSKLQAALCLTYPPVAVYKTHQPPEGSLTAPEGSHGCVIALLAAAAKGKTAAFQETTVGCPGGKAGLGFSFHWQRRSPGDAVQGDSCPGR